MTLQTPENPKHISSQTTPPASRIACIIARLRREDSGQDLIEYALAASLIGLTAVSSMNGLAVNISNSLDNIGSAVTNALPADNSGSPAPPSGGGNNGGRGGGRRGGGGGFGGGGGHHGGHRFF